MAQPANKRVPLGINAYCNNQTPEPPLLWEKLRVQYNLALLAERDIILDTLFRPTPEVVELPLESIYEETIIKSHSAESERESNARNAKQKKLAK